MPKLIAISKIGKYAQGEITAEMLQEMVLSYNKDFQAAPFIPEHRSFNEKGELINNLRALGWIQTLTTDGTFLYAMPEEEHELKWYYDGISFRYASIEIEVVRIDGKETLYCAAVAVTNFPAANIPKIEFNRQKIGSRLIAAYNKISITNNQEEEMKELLMKLAKGLGLADDATEDQVVAKLTEIKTELEGADQLKKYSTQFDGIIAALKGDGGDVSALQDTIVKLTEKVDALVAKYSANKSSDLEAAVDSAIAEGKFLPAQKDHLLKTYAENVEDFKTFAASAPKIQMNAQIIVPKTEGGSPITYNDLLNDSKLFEETKKNNPALFTQLKKAWLLNPSPAKKED